MDKEQILVVDDNRQLGDFLAYRLLPNLGYSGKIVYSGKAALEAIHLSPPTLIILDLELPDMSGLDILRQLNREGLQVPTILFTAHGSEQVAAEAFRLGVQDYLVKPAEPETLEAAISRALTETHLRQETIRLTNELKEQVTWLSALAKVGQSVTSSLELDDVLHRIVDAAVQLTQAEEGFLALLDSKGGHEFHLRAVKNIDEERARSSHIPVQDSLIGQAIRSGMPVRKSVESDQQSLKISTGYLVYSLLYVPIFSKGKPLGVLAVDNRTVRRFFARRDEVVLTSLGGYAAVALENVALYDQVRRELDERRRVEAALRESEERYALAVHGANDGIWDWNLKTNQIYFSPRWKSMLGYGEDEIRSDPQEWLSRVHPDDLTALKKALFAHLQGGTSHFEQEHRMRARDGSYRWILSRGLAVRAEDGAAARIAGSQTDISLSKEAETRLRHDAFTDQLTQLPNRAHFLERLKGAIQRTLVHKEHLFAVLYLDLDGFKFINDSLGHPAGDQLLIAVSAILQDQLRRGDMVARLGGDEFVILLDHLDDEELATSIARRIIQRLSAPIYLEKYNTRVATSASLGIVLSSLGYQAPDDVLRDADIAMYAAKGRGKSTYELYNPGLREQILRRLELETDLTQALERHQLTLFYQPLISLHDGQLLGFEALMRWQHPNYGLLAAQEFISIAQDAGLIIPINWWVFAEACRQTRAWQVAYPLEPSIKIFVHLTSSLITWPDLLQNIRDVLEQNDLDPHCLGLEIKENIATTLYEATSRIIGELRQMGVEVHIDNFGTGDASLVNLKRFVVDGLRIDRSFIQDISHTEKNAALVRLVVDLAHRFGLQATAEGIETEQQRRILAEMGCDAAQGNLFSAPLQALDAADLLERRLANPQSDPFGQASHKP